METYWNDKLVAEEGTRLFVYDDATGKAILQGSLVVGHPTIGTGRALDVHGISVGEAAFLFGNDVGLLEARLRKAFPTFDLLTAGRQFVLVSMAFNLGWAGLLSFHDTLAAVWSGKFVTAAADILASKAAKELPNRYKFLAYVMQHGDDKGFVA